MPEPTQADPLPPLWRWVERYFERKYDIHALGDDPGALLAYNLFRHSGAPVSLKTGETIRPGDLLMELHFRRAAIQPLIRQGDPIRVALEMRRMGEQELPRLARLVREDPGLREVCGLHALTLFYRGTTKMGFEVMPMEEGLSKRWFTWWHRVLMARDSSMGSARVDRYKEKLVTQHIWMSREELIRRHGSSPAPDAASPAQPRGGSRSARPES
jgi:peptidoglycan-N-acetylglucosamine deacetylase